MLFYKELKLVDIQIVNLESQYLHLAQANHNTSNSNIAAYFDNIS